MKKLGQMICRWGGETRALFHRVTAGCALLMLTVAAGCSEYDDAELRGSVDDLNNRLTKLEAQVTKLNSDYATLSGLVTTLQQQLHLESVTPDGKGGYLLAFSDGTTVSVAGSESVASIPVLGIAAAEDGLYYWTKTVDGKADWLLDTEGNKLPVSGVTPLLGVDADGYWTISYDGGKSVQQLLDAEGKPIVAQGDSAFIKEVTADAECLYVTLNDGKYLSFIDQGYIYFDKAAHPTSWKHGVTFDLETGEQLDWQDLVRPEDAEFFTLDRINAKIFLSKYQLSTYFEGLTELPKNYYLDENKVIHFIFGQYEIAPYSTGIVDISMGKKAK